MFLSLHVCIFYLLFLCICLSLSLSHSPYLHTLRYTSPWFPYLSFIHIHKTYYHFTLVSCTHNLHFPLYLSLTVYLQSFSRADAPIHTQMQTMFVPSVSSSFRVCVAQKFHTCAAAAAACCCLFSS